MTYNTIWTSVGDEALRGRITACVAQESRVGDDPYALFLQVQWPVITAQDIEAAYAYALSQDKADPGADPTVVTDQMILSHVQAALAGLAALEPSPTTQA